MFYYYFIEPHYVAWTGLEPLHSQLVLKLGSSCLSFKRTGVTVYITPGSLNYSRENFSQGALCPPKTSVFVYTVCNKYILLLNQVQPSTSSVFFCVTTIFPADTFQFLLTRSLTIKCYSLESHLALGHYVSCLLFSL